MSSTSQSRNRFQEQKIGQASIKLPTDAATRALLRTKLTRERTLLMASWNLSLTTAEDSEPCSDLADQASTDLDQDLAIQVKVRTIARLRAIERALELMRTSHYGRCRSCSGDIPYERLNVQPDTLFCVPCLTLVEQNSSESLFYA